MIDILVPVLGRPQNAALVVDSIAENTVVDFSVVFICSSGDGAEIYACKQTGARVMVIQGGLSEYPRKMNHAFRKTDREFVFLGSRRSRLREGLGHEALKVAKRTGAGVTGTADCHNPEVMRGGFSTHPLVRRSYVMESRRVARRPRRLCHEGYDHNQTDVGDLASSPSTGGLWAFAPNSRVCHNHPDWLNIPKDDTYKKGFRFWRRDQQLWAKRSRLLPLSTLRS